jgi:predicted RNA binding protein YcfA (HicA-like mRNA interferase family)
MPRKKRQLRKAYRAAGFSEREGKGDHTVFTHPLVRKNYSVDGKDSADADSGC